MHRDATSASKGWMSPGQPQARYANDIAATILVGSGFLWFGWGCARALPTVWSLWLALYAGTAILLWIAVRTWRAGKAELPAAGAGSGADSWQRRAGPFKRVLRAEACACGLVVLLCLAMRRWDLLAAGLALVVGLHFLPLARLFRFPVYHVTGGAIIAGVVFDAVHFDGVEMIGAVGASTGAALWLTAIHILLFARLLPRRGED